MRVADLFCGGGGISEGLKQAGFSIVFGLDNSKAAVETFASNHPTAEVVKASIEDYLISDIPDFDILVGGPPCVEFSASKQGRGNILAGLKLVQAFLRIVHIRKPRYWIMENVPKIVLHLPDKIPFSWIGIDEPGELSIPIRGHFRMADYGVPQARERFLMGNFPLPETTHYDPQNDALLGLAERKMHWVCLQDVLNSLPSPLKKRRKGEVEDVNYGISLEFNKLTDHFHEVELSEDEGKRIRKAKENHPFMGWMPFPDDTNRPARTVVATQLGRETLIIGENISGVERYRRATIRECAVLQGYPITYQIHGSSLAARYRVVGNGVPPMLVYRIGREICRKEGLSVPDSPLIEHEPLKPSEPILTLSKKKEPQYKLNRRFSDLVPGKDVRGCRVELTNQGENAHRVHGYTNTSKHLVEWACRLTVGEGKAKTKQLFVGITTALEIISPMLKTGDERETFCSLMKRVDDEVVSFLPDASTLQAKWARKISNVICPEDIALELGRIIEEYYPKASYHNVYIPAVEKYELLPRKGLRIRLGVALAVTAYCCEFINNGMNSPTIALEDQYRDPSWKPAQRNFIFKKPDLEHLMACLSD